MPPVIDYAIKVSICLAVVYIFYMVFLRRLTFYSWNRFYLLSYAALSFFIPLIDIMPELQKRELDEASILAWIPAFGYTQAAEQSLLKSLTYWDWTLLLIAVGILFCLARFSAKILSFQRMKRKAARLDAEHIQLYQLDEHITPFSFGNAIFINKHMHTEAELQEIIRHEFVHVKQKHTVDIIFCELFCALFWFNPFAWLIRRSIKQNLEFIADDNVVQNGFDKTEYQYLLLKVIGNKQFAFTNHFNFSSLKKRIAMMNAIKSAKVHLLKFLFILPVIAVILLSFRKEMIKASTQPGQTFVQDTIPAQDADYKIMVIKTTGGHNMTNENREVIDRISVKDWSDNKKFYEEKYDRKVAINTENTAGNDSVYVIRYKPKPIKPGEEPLVLLDGNEIPYASVSAIPPAEIQSFSVLTDRSSTAAYGEKAKNGVVMIITKNGFRPQNPPIPGLKGKVNGIRISTDKPESNEGPNKDSSKQGAFRLHGMEKALTILDGKEISEEGFKKVKAEDIESISVLKDQSGIQLYGEKGKNGVIMIETKNKNGSKPVLLQEVGVEEPHSNKGKKNLGIVIAKKNEPSRDVAKNNGEEVIVRGYATQKPTAGAKNLHVDKIESSSVFKSGTAAKTYGEKSKNGVLLVTTKNGKVELKDVDKNVTVSTDTIYLRP